MKKPAFIANMIVWGLLSAVGVAFIVWANAVGGVPDDNVALLTLSIFARPVTAFSLAALICGLIVKKCGLALGRKARIAWRVLGVLPAALLLLSPFAIPVLPDGVATVFAVTLILAMTVPVAFLLFGVFYGLSLADEKAPEADEGAEE